LWHGASWTYVWWGLLNGMYLIIGWLTKGWRDRFFNTIGLGEQTLIRKSIMWASTFSLTCMAWIVFRAKSLTDAWYVFSHLLQNWNIHQVKTVQFPLRQLPVALAAILVLEACQLWFQDGASVSSTFGKLSLPGRWTVYAGLVMLVVMFGIYRKTQFIYFQF
jgi:alginate O-acetyltransferase complex protein AlgI